MAKVLWERLNPQDWPLSWKALPIGSALVGGAVRDGLLNRTNQKPDLDLVIPKNAIETAKGFAEKLGGRAVVLDIERDMARLVVDGWTIDMAGQIGPSLVDDLWRRDFRINAVALTLESCPKLLDPTGGLPDLEHKLLVAVSTQNLLEDPLRGLRGLRLMAELNFALDSETRTFIKTHANLLLQASPERIQSELSSLVSSPWADEALGLILESALLRCWRPSNIRDLEEFRSANESNLLNFSELSVALPLVRLTYLLSDFGLKSLRFSRRQCQRCSTLRKWQESYYSNEFSTLSEYQLLQLHKDLEEDLPALIIQFPLKLQKNWITRWRDVNDPLFHPRAPVDGNTLQKELCISSGPKLGLLMDYLSLERAFGRLSNVNETIEKARYWWKRH